MRLIGDLTDLVDLTADVGGSFTVPIAGGRLVLGTWQQILLCDFDNRPRRRVVVQVLGE